MSKFFLVKLLAALCLVDYVGLFIAVATSSTSNDDDYTNNVRYNKEKRKRPHIVIILADDMVSNCAVYFRLHLSKNLHQMCSIYNMFLHLYTNVYREYNIYTFYIL